MPRNPSNALQVAFGIRGYDHFYSHTFRRTVIATALQKLKIFYAKTMIYKRHNFFHDKNYVPLGCSWPNEPS